MKKDATESQFALLFNSSKSVGNIEPQSNAALQGELRTSTDPNGLDGLERGQGSRERKEAVGSETVMNVKTNRTTN